MMQWDQHIFHLTYSWTVWKDESQVWVLDILYPPKIQKCHLKRDHFTIFHKQNSLPTSIFQGQTPKFSWGLDDVCVCVCVCVMYDSYGTTSSLRLLGLLHDDSGISATDPLLENEHNEVRTQWFVFIACFTSLPIYLAILFPTSLPGLCISQQKPFVFCVISQVILEKQGFGRKASIKCTSCWVDP